MAGHHYLTLVMHKRIDRLIHGSKQSMITLTNISLHQLINKEITILDRCHQFTHKLTLTKAEGARTLVVPTHIELCVLPDSPHNWATVTLPPLFEVQFRAHLTVKLTREPQETPILISTEEVHIKKDRMVINHQ